MKKVFLGLLLAMSTTQAGEWAGDVSRQSSEVDTLCIELDEKNSPHLQKICLKKINVKWKLKTSEQSALLRSSIQWQLQPSLWLRGDGNKKRALKSFTKDIQTAYNATVPTDMTLAAFFYPDVNSAPSDTGSAIDNMGIALKIGAGALAKSGDAYSFSTPSGTDWGSLLSDAPGHIPCTQNTSAFVPEDVSKELVRDGMSLAGLTICQATFADLKQLNDAIQKTCRQCKAGTGPTTADKGISLDDLLAEIDAGSSEQVSEIDDLALAKTEDSGDSLDDLLGGVEDGIKEKRLGEAKAERQAAFEAEQRQLVAQEQACRQAADYFEKTMAKLMRRLTQPADNSNSRYGHWDKGGDCSPIINSINSTPSYKVTARGLYDCINHREDLIENAREKIKNVDFKGCSFEGGDPKDNFEAMAKLVDEENYYYDDQLGYIEDLQRGAAIREQAAANAAIDRARMEAIWGSNSGSNNDVDSAQNLKDISNNHSYQNSLAPKLKLKTQNTATFSYPETAQTGLQPPDDNCYLADGSKASGTEFQYCVAQRNNSKKRSVSVCGNNDGSGGGCDKTQ